MAGRRRKTKAFSSEVETGSRQENASNQESRAPFRFNRNGKGSSSLLKNSDQMRFRATIESRVAVFGIYRAYWVRFLNQCCSWTPSKNLFQQTARRSARSPTPAATPA